MSKKIAVSRAVAVAASLAAAAAASLTLAAGASANTYNASDTASFIKAVNSANANTGANTIVVTGANYVPTSTITFTNKTGPLTIVNQTYGLPVAKFVGSSVQPYPSPLFVISSGVTVNFNNVGVSAGGGPGTTAIDDNGTVNFDQSLIAGTIGSGLLVEPNASASANNSEFSDGNDFGIVNQGTLTLLNDTIAFNAVGGLDTSVGLTTMVNTIVANNGGNTPTDCYNGKPATVDHSLDSDGSCGVGALSKKDPLLVSNPTYNGGSHPTHYLKTGSPAIDAANSAKCPAVDERNVARPDDAGTGCDIGAVEWNNTPPTWSGTSDRTVPATSSSGATVNYDAKASSPDDVVSSQSCSPPSGSTFAIGTTTVNCTATDGYGATSTASFKVTVTQQSTGDTTPPVWQNVPADMTVEATGPSGAPVSYATPTATDPDDAVASQSCSPASGTTFALGTTTVTCIAKDTHGNTATATFKVTVKDTTPPAITTPPDQRVAAADSSGAVVNYPAATATDTVDGPVPVSCSPASGSKFPVGPTTVTCTAQDKAGNPSSKRFTVTVDNTPPAISTQGDVTADASGPDGAQVPYTVTATDPDDADVSLTCDHPSRSTFPLGTTAVICTAKDSVGNTATATFNVTVKDTTPPDISTPGFMRVPATDASGAVVDYTVTATDKVDGSVPVNCSPAAGSRFPLGTTTVNCTASDRAGNTSTATFRVAVRDVTPPVLTMPGDMQLTATSASGATANYAPSAIDDVDGAVPVTCSPASGTAFPVGPTTVTCTARDKAGNKATAAFKVTVLPKPSTSAGPTPSAKALASVSQVVVQDGEFGLNVACAGPRGSCTITVRLTAFLAQPKHRSHTSRVRFQTILAAKTTTLAAGQTETVHIRLGKVGSRALARNHRLGVLLEVMQVSNSGSRTATAKRLVLTSSKLRRSRRHR